MKIIALINEGYSQRQVVKRKASEKHNLSLPKSGRPRSTTPQEDRFITVTSLRNRRATASDIQASMDHSPVRQSFKFENNFSTVGKDFLNLEKL